MPSRAKRAGGVAVVSMTLACLLPACGKDTDESPDAASDDGGTLGTFPDPTKCVTLAACVSSTCPPTQADGGFGCYWQCGQPTLCGLVHFTQTATSYTVDATNVQCLLGALRDGAPGEVAWGSTMGGATYQEDANLIGSRQSYGWWQFREGGSGGAYQFGRYAGHTLQNAAYFETCMASTDPATWLKCLQGAYVDCP